MQWRLSVAVRAVVGCFIAVVATCAAAQQPYPSKTIRIIVPLVPGGSTNTVARLVSEKLKESLGQPVVVENRAGGNGIIGTEAVAKSAPDGYTLLINSGTHTILPFVEPKLPYDVLKDFTPLASLGRTRYMMLVHPSVPAKNLKEFIALAKSRPGQLNFGSSGTAGGSRLAGEVFNMMAGVRMQNVPYRGGGAVVADLIGGHIEVSFNSPTLSAPYIAAGRVRGLAIAGQARLPLLPQIPTFIEAGLPGYDEQAWYGMYAAAATPKPIVDRLNAEIAKMQAAPDVKEIYTKDGLEPFVSTPEQFAAFLKADTTKLAKLIKAANLKFSE